MCNDIAQTLSDDRYRLLLLLFQPLQLFQLVVQRHLRLGVLPVEAVAEGPPARPARGGGGGGMQASWNSLVLWMP